MPCDKRTWSLKTIAVVKQSPGKCVIVIFVVMHMHTNFYPVVKDFKSWIKYWPICLSFPPARVLRYMMVDMCLKVFPQMHKLMIMEFRLLFLRKVSILTISSLFICNNTIMYTFYFVHFH